MYRNLISLAFFCCEFIVNAIGVCAPETSMLNAHILHNANSKKGSHVCIYALHVNENRLLLFIAAVVACSCFLLLLYIFEQNLIILPATEMCDSF